MGAGIHLVDECGGLVGMDQVWNRCQTFDTAPETCDSLDLLLGGIFLTYIKWKLFSSISESEVTHNPGAPSSFLFLVAMPGAPSN